LVVGRLPTGSEGTFLLLPFADSIFVFFFFVYLFSFFLCVSFFAHLIDCESLWHKTTRDRHQSVSQLISRAKRIWRELLFLVDMCIRPLFYFQIKSNKKIGTRWKSQLGQSRYTVIKSSSSHPTRLTRWNET
jgi:hypothetical protein